MRLLDILRRDANNISSGFTLSMFLAIFIAMMAVVLQWLSSLTLISLSGQWAFFFFITFLCLFLCIEWFVEREQKKVDALKREEIANLKKIELYRREFLAEVSHELRTPIFAVQGFIDTLIDGAIDDENVRMKFLRKAAKSTDRLSNLVNDLLVITQMEAGEIEMKMRRFVLYDLLEEVIEALEYKFVKPEKGRNITCQIQAQDYEGTVVLADRERIFQVITNLVDNAIKYGNPQGHIVINVREKNEKLEVAVKDDGPGIASEHLEEIFRRFYRIDKSRSRETGGTGLGLSICKHFVEAHGDQLIVESVEGEGAVFRFCLHIAE